MAQLSAQQDFSRLALPPGKRILIVNGRRRPAAIRGSAPSRPTSPPSRSAHRAAGGRGGAGSVSGGVKRELHHGAGPARQRRASDAMSCAVRLTPDIADTIRRAARSFVASVNEDGSANIAPNASLGVHDGGLMFANMASSPTIANLRRDPRVTVVVVDFFRRRGFRLVGTAAVWEPGPAVYEIGVERVWKAHGEAFPVHEVATLAIAAPLLSPAYRFGDQPSEETIEAALLRRYGGARRIEGAEE